MGCNSSGFSASFTSLSVFLSSETAFFPLKHTDGHPAGNGRRQIEYGAEAGFHGTGKGLFELSVCLIHNLVLLLKILET